MRYSRLNERLDTAWLTGLPMAHRGLHDKDKGIFENSASAFSAAVAAGYGMECDIQLSADGEAMVFHDATLERMTTGTGRLFRQSAKEIGALNLATSSDRVQTLGELLDQIGGKTPLLVELKNIHQIGALEQRTADLLSSYKGEVAVMSFNPASMRWFAQNAPQVIRGQLSHAFISQASKARPALQRFLARHLFVDFISKPHFIGYDINHLPRPAPTFLRRLGKPILSWTVSTRQHRETAAKHADNIIFEGFTPSLNWARTHE
jgi:glycerophosphoryl diester phosphodiesterase